MHTILITVSPLLPYSTPGSANSIVCDLSDERPKEEKLSFKEVKEQRTKEQVTKEKEVGEEEEEGSEDLGNRRKKKGYGGGEGEAELLKFYNNTRWTGCFQTRVMQNTKIKTRVFSKFLYALTVTAVEVYTTMYDNSSSAQRF